MADEQVKLSENLVVGVSECQIIVIQTVRKSVSIIQSPP